MERISCLSGVAVFCSVKGTGAGCAFRFPGNKVAALRLARAAMCFNDIEYIGSSIKINNVKRIKEPVSG